MKKLIIALALSCLLSGQAWAMPASGTVNKAQPSANSDGVTKTFRIGKYAEQYVVPLSAGLYGIADEGSYFSAMTATPGTGYALGGATQTAWVATTPSVYIKNGGVAGAKALYIDQCRLTITAAGTGITSVNVAVVLDKGARTTSAGTALTVANVNGASSTTSISSGVVAGAVTASAATTPVYLYRGSLKNAAPVIGDNYVINFGAMDSSGSAAGATSAGPVVVDGGQSLLIYAWYPGSTAQASGEWQCSWWER
jgi:hypothetical protein